MLTQTPTLELTLQALIRSGVLTQHAADSILRHHCELEQRVIRLTLDGPIVPKARPRGVLQQGRLVFMTDSKYGRWKTAAKNALKNQYAGMTVTNTRLRVTLSGKHNRGGDSDNLVGSIMDALVQSGVLAEDNIKRVYGLQVIVNWNNTDEPTALIELLDPVAEVKLPGMKMQTLELGTPC